MCYVSRLHRPTAACDSAAGPVGTGPSRRLVRSLRSTDARRRQKLAACRQRATDGGSRSNSCTIVLVYSCTRVLVYSCTRVPVYPCTRVPVYPCTRVPVYPCTRVLVYSCTPVLLYSCTPVLLYSCTRIMCVVVQCMCNVYDSYHRRLYKC